MSGLMRLAWMRIWKKAACRGMAWVLAAGCLGALAPARADAESIWSMQASAERAADAGDMEKAVPLWETLTDHFASVGDWESAAIYAGYLDEYYDRTGQYEKAIVYYERENEYWLKFGKDWGAVDVQRAEQIRTVLDLYVSTNDADAVKSLSAPASGGELAKFEPESGLYIGIYSEQDPEMGNVFSKSESVYGKKHAIYLAYTQWGKPFPAQYAKNARAAEGALQIAFEPDDGLAEVVDGDYIRTWARAAKAAEIPIFLRFACEMNGDWVRWYGDPQTYIEKFRLVHRIMSEEAPNVAMVWSPNDVPRYSMAAYYPGDDAVDWVGISMYTEPYENGDPNHPALGASPVERLDEVYKLYADRKPIMISETAVSHYTHEDGQAWTEWALANLARLYEIMPKKYPRLKAITYFNVDLNGRESNNDYLLRNNEAVFAAYKTMIAGPYYLSKVETGAKPPSPIGYVKADHQATFAGKVRIVPFVKIPEVFVGKVVYDLNGQTVAEEASAPYSLELEAGDVPEGSVLETRVYRPDGSLAVSRSIGLSSVVSVRIDGEEQRFEQPPVIAAGSTLAPLRAVFEAIGATVEWDQASRTATARKGGTTVAVTIGKREARCNRDTVALEVPAQLVNGYAMVPVRFAGEAFGGTVSWDGRTRTADIRTKGDGGKELSGLSERLLKRYDESLCSSSERLVRSSDIACGSTAQPVMPTGCRSEASTASFAKIYIAELQPSGVFGFGTSLAL